MSWEIWGHTWAVDLLQGHLRQQRLRHAYLFCGPAGVGRRTLALRFAQALNCPTPPGAGQSCGTCRTCRQIAQMAHPDLFPVQAESGSIKVEQVRALQHDLQLAPYESPYRVALLLNLERATPSAQNALLKTLEEPPAHAVLLLTAEAPEALLPTLVSRCEVLRLRPLPITELETLLRDHQGLPYEQARELAHLSGGRPGLALRFHNEPEYYQEHQRWIQDGLYLLGQKRVERFQYVESLSRDREKMRAALQAWVTLWRDLWLCTTNAPVPLTNLAFETPIRTLARQLEEGQAARCLAMLEQGITHLDANLNARLLGEFLLLGWPYLTAVEDEIRA
ncbi:DNA polymerase III subunit delta' [uncultured Thermanaerothrix sp.]|uniref:DNA polymerase III subunit delta' n=1 Tax=uncultured Thermanaerothrix sp. TaxID=1195149 RepID=UPI00261B63BD|nr:DNA polymerase III subunit delta' [uncultured Thermanaerothrix sp.]